MDTIETTASVPAPAPEQAPTPTPVEQPPATTPPEQPPAPETPPPEAVEEKPDPEAEWNKRFTDLNRQQRQLINEKKIFKEEVDRYKAEVSEYRTKMAQAIDNPLSFLEEAGWTFRDLAEFVQNDRKLTEAQRYKMQIKKQEKEKQVTEKETAREQEIRREQILTNFQNQIVDICSTSDDYDLIQAYDAYDMVFNVCKEHAATTGQLLPIEEAAKQVQNYLDENTKNRILKTKRYASLVNPANVETKQQQTAEPPKIQPQSSPSTLTHTHASASVSTPQAPRYLSEDESKAAAAEFLRRELAKKNA